eukprot:s178_g20.t1
MLCNVLLYSVPRTSKSGQLLDFQAASAPTKKVAKISLAPARFSSRRCGDVQEILQTALQLLYVTSFGK